MKSTVRWVAVAACGMVGAAGAAAQDAAPPQSVATVNQAVERAINYQPEVQTRWQAFLAAGEDRRVAKGGLLPSIDVSGEFGAANREFDNRDWFGRDFAEISITQMLFDGFLVRSQLREADATRLTRYYELLDEVQRKALEAIEAYQDVRQFRATVALAQQNLETHQDVLRLISERTQSGVGNGADLQQATGRLALAQANLLTEQANLNDVSARFQRIVGTAPAEILADIASAADQVPSDRGSVMSSALRNHPSLFAAQATIQAAEAQIAQTRSAYYPRITAAGRTGTYRNTSSFDASFDPRGRGQESFVGLNLNYNLYRGGADKARERAAERRLDQSRELLNKACVDLRQTAAIALNNVSNLAAKMDALQAHRAGAQSVATAYEQQFYIGRRTLLDVLDARNEAFQAERALAQAGFELSKAQYQTLYSMGTLLDVLGQSRAGLPVISSFDDNAARPASIDCSAAGIWSN